MPGDRFDAWFQLRFPVALRWARPDLVHLPATVAPAICPAPCVVTVHDLIPLKLAGEVSPQRALAFGRGLRSALRKAVHLITVSAATRDELHAEFGVPADHMTVIPWAPDQHVAAQAPAARAADNAARIRARYRLGPRWLVTFAGSGRRKNPRGVIDGFARTDPAVRRGVQVVLVGCEPAAHREMLATVAERAGIADQVRVLGFVPHEDVATLLAGACGLLMPSLYEGFGLPILDAFACDVPVLTSAISSMPEVAGDAAIYCQPNDSQSIADAIAQLLEPDTAADLVQRGRTRLDAFSWQRTAEAMCGAYEHAAERIRVARGSVTRVHAGGVV
jgi:glycosyltransferase involved in cell wall biosynthesis